MTIGGMFFLHIVLSFIAGFPIPRPGLPIDANNLIHGGKPRKPKRACRLSVQDFRQAQSRIRTRGAGNGRAALAALPRNDRLHRQASPPGQSGLIFDGGGQVRHFLGRARQVHDFIHKASLQGLLRAPPLHGAA